MSMISEDLQRLLDERGIEWKSEPEDYGEQTIWQTPKGKWCFYSDNSLRIESPSLTIHGLAPEQVVAATLGIDVKDCENLLWEFIGALDVADATDADRKPIVFDYARRISATLGNGTLTAGQVRDAIEQHSMWVIGNNRCFRDGAYEEIAAELNATLGDERIKRLEKLIRAMYLDLLAEMPESLLEDRLIQMGELGIEVYGDDD